VLFEICRDILAVKRSPQEADPRYTSQRSETPEFEWSDRVVTVTMFDRDVSEREKQTIFVSCSEEALVEQPQDTKQELHLKFVVRLFKHQLTSMPLEYQAIPRLQLRSQSYGHIGMSCPRTGRFRDTVQPASNQNDAKRPPRRGSVQRPIRRRGMRRGTRSLSSRISNSILPVPPR